MFNGGEKMINAGIIVNMDKSGSLELTKEMVEWFESNGNNVLLMEQTAISINRQDIGYAKIDLYKKSDILFVIGGDGTLLRVAREVAAIGIPILGINMGHLGFIAEVEVKDIFSSLRKVLNNDYKIEERMMIEASIYRQSGIVKRFYALNDICFTKGALSRIIKLDTYVNDEYVNTYNADGLLISTPTGSTAYSLSAGGPIVCPNVNVMIITPICSHSLSSRAIIVSKNDVICVDAFDNDDSVYLTADGQEGYRLWQGDKVYIKRSSFTAKFIKVSNLSFYDVLRTKLKG